MNFLVKFKFLKTYRAELILLFSLALILFRIDLTWFNTHMSRDLLRSELWLHGQAPDWLGPEMGWDYKRLPGPAYYLLLAPLTLLNSITAILVIKILVLYAIIFLLTQELKKQYPSVVTAFLLIFTLMPVFFFTSRNLWNPSNIIIFNCLQFYFLLKFKATSSLKWLWISLLTALLGLQFHFSTLLLFLASGLSLLLTGSRKVKLTQLACFAILATWLSIWYFYYRVPMFDEQLQQFYGKNPYLAERWSDLRYHLSLSLLEIKDYDLFTLLTKSLGSLDLINYPYLENTSKFLNYFFSAAFVFSIILVIRDLFRKMDLVKAFLVFHTLFFLISIMILKNKINIPYRYGLCFYPVQFFLIVYGFTLLPDFFKKFGQRFLTGCCIFTFLFYTYFDLKVIQAQNVTGRSHHTNNDNLELTLKNKEFLYNFLLPYSASGHDPFISAHGRTINKFRNKEMNWAETEAYFSLYRNFSSAGASINEDVVNLPLKKNWLIQLKNMDELKKDASSNLKILPLQDYNLPQDLSISYFNHNDELLQSIEWKNSSYILPQAFAKQPAQTESLLIKFHIDSTKSRFLYLLLNDNADYSYIYKANYKIEKLTAGAEILPPLKNYKGYFLVQNQYIYELPPKDKLAVELKLKIENASNYKNFSRVDLFTTDSILPEEELFPKTDSK